MSFVKNLFSRKQPAAEQTTAPLEEASGTAPDTFAPNPLGAKGFNPQPEPPGAEELAQKVTPAGEGHPPSPPSGGEDTAGGGGPSLPGSDLMMERAEEDELPADQQGSTPLPPDSDDTMGGSGFGAPLSELSFNPQPEPPGLSQSPVDDMTRDPHTDPGDQGPVGDDEPLAPGAEKGAIVVNSNEGAGLNVQEVSGTAPDTFHKVMPGQDEPSAPGAEKGAIVVNSNEGAGLNVQEVGLTPAGDDDDGPSTLMKMPESDGQMTSLGNQALSPEDALADVPDAEGIADDPS